MCAMTRIVFFWAKRYKPDIAQRLVNRIGRCASILVIFWPRDTKADIAHRLANRIGRCAMMHVVMFLAKRYKVK